MHAARGKRPALAQLALPRFNWCILRDQRNTPAALEPDYVMLGGGNANKIDHLPRKVRLGVNTNAFEGGFRLWKKGVVKPPGARR